ncbi:ABC transporter ATP-binding protein [Ramlibacter sp. WS9]|uniref:ABC transporter ATP-binding protein n=1 Tax=Ramlibacter sp. WS9 TaxID=1882741 RepID=UPI001142443C|nr:ABC transporter ATP-binding protein [Ramlibacter sp. WS9]ROZ64111.1 ABC transporter ATP-binding protein [Ramlibacter sp. WS9]
MSGLLQVRQLKLRYPGAPADTLQDVSFDVPAGSLTALLGPSGCGKTTVLRAIAGLAQPDGGQLLLEGNDLALLPAEQRPVGMVFQEGALFPHLDAHENVMFPLEAAGVAPREALARARHALDAVGLAGFGSRWPSTLSGGEQQRVAVARALAQAPAVLLLDEPLSSVEPRLRRALREEIRDLQRRLGLTVIYVTHDQREALAVSDHVVLMEAGRVVQAGSPRSLYESPATAFAAAFMGEASIVTGHRDAAQSVWLGPIALAQPHAGAEGPVQVAVRPEAWRVLHCAQPGLAGRIVKRSFLGRQMEYMVETQLGAVLVHVPAVGAGLEPGAPVSLQLAGHGAWVAGG